MLALDARDSLARALAGGIAMSVAFSAAAFAWFGHAIGEFTGLGSPAGVLLLLLASPLLQPQMLVFALVRQRVEMCIRDRPARLLVRCSPAWRWRC